MSRTLGPSGLRVIVNTEGLRIPVAAARLREAVEATLRAQKVKNALVSVTLMRPAKMAALNVKHLKHSGATDIITFGFRDPVGAAIGDIYICPSVATARAPPRSAQDIGQAVAS